ncbi:MAG: hypothetical protein AMXMBFR75_19320 [Candidatus Hinthialibacteria bacterium]
MDMPILMGCMWGVLTAGVHFLLLRKSLNTVGNRPMTPSVWIWRISSTSRILAVGVILVMGVLWKNLRLDAAIVTYAVLHTVMMIGYGVYLSGHSTRTGVESVD